MKNIFTFLLLIVFIAVMGYGQTGEGKFGIFGGLSMPQGEFADDDFEDDSGFAKMGFCIGGEYVKQLNSPGLSWVTNISVVLNGLDEDPIAEGYEEMAYEDFTADAGSYINVPIMTGLRYSTETSPTMQMYGIAQIGLNYMKYPTIELQGDDGSADIEIDATTSFGFAIGGGIIMNNKFNIGIRYLTFGDQDVDGELKIPYEDDVQIEGEFSLSYLLITIGIPLGSN
jgi:hypothetical protein